MQEEAEETEESEECLLFLGFLGLLGFLGFLGFCPCYDTPIATLVLIRHGQSQWNLENRFAGWTDVPLTDQGRSDARKAGEVLKDFRFDCAWTSRLSRASETLTILLDVLKQTIPIEYDSALNERHYGDLQGLNKAETARKFGQEQVKLWRRSYATRPPNGESIEDCERRTTPFFLQYILPQIAEGKNVLVAAHGNSMRPIIKYLEKLEPENAASMEIGLCIPYIYTFTGTTLVRHTVRDVPGIVTLGASTSETILKEGRI